MPTGPMHGRIIIFSLYFGGRGGCPSGARGDTIAFSLTESPCKCMLHAMKTGCLAVRNLSFHVWNFSFLGGSPVIHLGGLPREHNAAKMPLTVRCNVSCLWMKVQCLRRVSASFGECCSASSTIKHWGLSQWSTDAKYSDNCGSSHNHANEPTNVLSQSPCPTTVFAAGRSPLRLCVGFAGTCTQVKSQN